MHYQFFIFPQTPRGNPSGGALGLTTPPVAPCGRSGKNKRVRPVRKVRVRERRIAESEFLGNALWTIRMKALVQNSDIGYERS